MKFNKHLSIFKHEVVIRVESLLKEQIGKSNLYLDGSWNPDEHVNNCGIVESVPIRLSKALLYLGTAGFPLYKDTSPSEYVTADQLQIDVKPGDKVYFKYNVLANIINQKRFHDYAEDELGVQEINGKNWLLIKCPLQDIYAAVRNGKIYGQNTWNIIKPKLESMDDILIPVPYVDEKGEPMRDKEGKIQFKPKDKWIQTKSVPENKPMIGKIVGPSKPLIGRPEQLKRYDEVIFKEIAIGAKRKSYQVEIEGKNYFAVREHNIYCKLVDL